MNIAFYSFGQIKLSGKKYSSDLIIYPDRIDDSWWRKEGHRLYLEDLKEVIEFKPKLLVIGTGNSGLMKVPGKVVDALNDKEIDVYIDKTPAAVKIYNENNEQNIVAALHLTC